MAFDLATAEPVKSGGFDLSTAKPVDSAPEKPKGMGTSDYLAMLPEALAHLGSGAIAAPAAGLAGITQGIQNLYDKTAGNPVGRSAADAVQSTQDALTYSPRTQGGQTLSNKIAAPFQKFAEGADWAGGKVASATGSPMLGAGVNTAIQGLPLLLGAKLPGGIPKAAPAVAPAVSDAMGAGLLLTPEQAGGGLLGRAVQSLAGSAKLERSISKTNAPVVNDLAKQEIGIPTDQPINETTIADAKKPHNAVYDKVSKLGTVPTDATYQADIANVANRTGSGSFAFNVSPAVTNLKTGFGGVTTFDAGDAVAQIRQLRKDANMNLGQYDPEKNALGTAQKGVADALEDQLDRHVQTLAQSGFVAPDLISQLRDSRVQLAKINSVERALDGSNVSAKALAKQQDRGAPLSGNLATIADAYGNFDRSLQDVSKIRDSGPFGVLDGMLGAGAGLAHPGLFASILARPAARAALASAPYQRILQSGSAMAPPSIPGLFGSARMAPILAEMQRAGLLGQQQQPQGLLAGPQQ